jgi:hypothetical protein
MNFGSKPSVTQNGGAISYPLRRYGSFRNTCPTERQKLAAPLPNTA